MFFHVLETSLVATRLTAGRSVFMFLASVSRIIRCADCWDLAGGVWLYTAVCEWHSKKTFLLLIVGVGSSLEFA